MQIPLKKKYRTQDTGRSYSRNHSGNGNKKTKKLGVGNSAPYDRNQHVLVLMTTGKKRFYHGQEALDLLGK